MSCASPPYFFEQSRSAANPVSVPIAMNAPSGLQPSAETDPCSGGAIGSTRDDPISATTTSPSLKPPATISSRGWQATCVQVTPSPPASSSGALPIGPPPKNGQITIASAPLLASHFPVRVKLSDWVFAG